MELLSTFSALYASVAASLLALGLVAVIAVRDRRMDARRALADGDFGGQGFRLKPMPGGKVVPVPAFGPSEQLNAVIEARFGKKRLFAKEDAGALEAAEAALRQAGLRWRAMAQVPVGDILTCGDPRAFAAVETKHVAVLLATRAGDPVAVVDAGCDAAVAEALRRAGIALVAPASNGRADLRQELLQLSRRKPFIAASA
jgi:hypothetical protein